MPVWLCQCIDLFDHEMRREKRKLLLCVFIENISEVEKEVDEAKKDKKNEKMESI